MFESCSYIVFEVYNEKNYFMFTGTALKYDDKYLLSTVRFPDGKFVLKIKNGDTYEIEIENHEIISSVQFSSSLESAS